MPKLADAISLLRQLGATATVPSPPSTGFISSSMNARRSIAYQDLRIAAIAGIQRQTRVEFTFAYAEWSAWGRDINEDPVPRQF